MIIYAPTTAICMGRDERGDVIFPAQAVAVVIGQPVDATTARFVGYVRGLGEAWRKGNGKS